MAFDLQIPAGIVLDDTSKLVGGKAWRDCEKMRFRRDLPEVIGGWERLQTGDLEGVCRNLLSWSDGEGGSYLAFGTHSHLFVNFGGELLDVTPSYVWAAARLPANPLTTTNGSAVVTVGHVQHGYSTGDLISVSGATAVGGITPNIASVAITVTGANAYTFAFTGPASSAATGGGSAVVIQPLAAFEVGAEHGTGGAGYGTGAYSSGEYSEPSTANYFPRTWSLANWGSTLMANPRGGGIYWSEDPQAEAVATGAPMLANAPRRVNVSLVTEQRQVIAFGCAEEASGDFNPMCARWSDVENPEVWTSDPENNAGEWIFEGGGRIVGAGKMGPRLLVWSDKALYLGTWIGSETQGWDFDAVAGGSGLLGPNAFVIWGQRAWWITPAGKLMNYMMGGEPGEQESPVFSDLWDNLATSQGDKVVASSYGEAREIRFDYPDARDGDGLENSRYVAFTLRDSAPPAWSRGTMARSAYQDAGPQGYPVGVTPDGVAYWHERGRAADGGRWRAWIESADQYDSDGGAHLYFTMMEPDFHGQRCPITLTFIGRDFAQSEEDGGETSDGRNYGPFVVAVGATRVPLRAEGRLVRTRLESYSADNAWRLGLCGFTLTTKGTR